MKKLLLTTARLGLMMAVTSLSAALLAYPAGVCVGIISHLFIQGMQLWPGQ